MHFHGVGRAVLNFFVRRTGRGPDRVNRSLHTRTSLRQNRPYPEAGQAVPCMKWLLLLFCLLITVTSAMEISERSKKLSALLFSSISDPTRFDIEMAKKILGQFKGDDAIHGLIGDSMPVLHYLLNMYRLSSTDQAKAKVVEIMLLCLHHGANAAESYRADPPLLFKIVVVKELNLATQALQSCPEAGTELLFSHARWSAGFFSSLYSIPSESVPLVKLLLFADTLVHEKGWEKLGGQVGLKAFLATAGLGKPTVKPADLDKHSASYSTLVSALGGEQIRLVDVVRCLDETAGVVHQAMLGAIQAIPDASAREHAALQLVKVITAASELSEHSTTPYGMGRNALHFLGLSGSVLLVEQLVGFVASLQQFPVGADGEPTSAETESLHAACAQLLKQALLAEDARGHTPVSYAVMRFSAAGPSAQAIRRLVEAVGLSFDAAVQAAQARGVLRAQTTEGSIAMGVSGPEGANENGGWAPDQLQDAGAVFPSVDTAAGARAVLEVVTDTLPTNKEFFKTYVNTGTPVVFRHAVAPSPPAPRSASTSTLRRVFERSAFLARYGNISVPAASIPYAGTFGVQQFKSTMSAVANSASQLGEIPMYTFCTPDPQWRAMLLADVPVPGCIARNPADPEDSGIGAMDSESQSWSFEVQFYLGPAGTGAPVHFHGHAINSLAYGEKHWLLFPPAEAYYSTRPARTTFEALQHGSRMGEGTGREPIRVVQRAGDVLFVPALWGHATLNAQQSIGVAHEFTVESFCME